MCARSMYSVARIDASDRRSRSPFITPNTNLAAYLTVTGKLHYCGARPSAVHDGIEFLFDDPENLGAQLMRAFKSRTAAPADPNALFEAQGFLKSEVKRIRVGVANVKPVTI